MSTRGKWPNGRSPWPVWSQRPQEPGTVVLPVPELEQQGDKAALRIAGSQVATKGAAIGKFVGPGGLVDTFAQASNLKGKDGSNGTNGVNGASGWTPVLTPEQDGTRSLLKVSDWMNGSGTKPQAGMYLAEGGYVTDKTKAFNFNIAKRLATYSATTGSNGQCTITFDPAFAAAPRVFATSRGSTTGRPMVTEVISVSGTQAVIQVSRSKATLASLVSTLFDVLTGAQVDVIVVEA